MYMFYMCVCVYTFFSINKTILTCMCDMQFYKNYLMNKDTMIDKGPNMISIRFIKWVGAKSVPNRYLKRYCWYKCFDYVKTCFVAFCNISYSELMLLFKYIYILDGDDIRDPWISLCLNYTCY